MEESLTYESSKLETLLTLCEENNEQIEQLNKKIAVLISKQQNYNRIAQFLDIEYSPFCDTQNLQKSINILEKQLLEIAQIAENISVCGFENANKIIEELTVVSEKVKTLLAYFYVSKNIVDEKVADRFEELNIIEENSLKKGIMKKVIITKATAELTKLDIEQEYLQSKNKFKRFIGFFTGQNKIDEVKLNQIEFERTAIIKYMNYSLGIDRNHSIHEILADIDTFLFDNMEYDEEIKDEIDTLVFLKTGLRRYFIIDEERVDYLLKEREKKILPIDTKKLTKEELIEKESYRFLNKNGYDKSEEESNIIEDTSETEIKRISEYIYSVGDGSEIEELSVLGTGKLYI